MPTKTRKLRPRVAARRRRRCEAPPSRRTGQAPPTVTIEITEVETLSPHQQAARDWFVRRVQATIARQRQQQESEVPHADAR